jgi:hypothetical protein
VVADTVLVLEAAGAGVAGAGVVANIDHAVLGVCVCSVPLALAAQAAEQSPDARGLERELRLMRSEQVFATLLAEEVVEEGLAVRARCTAVAAGSIERAAPSRRRLVTRPESRKA